MKIFVINLKSESERRLAMQQQADRLNLNIEFIDAVYGSDLSDTYLSEIVYDYPGCKLTKGEIGCSLSHLLIYKKIVDENIQHALILEDDAILSQDLKNALNEIKLIDCVRKPNVFLLSPPESYIKNIKLKSRKYDIHYIYEASGAYGYVINNKSARQLIRRMSPLKWECDMWGVFRMQRIVNVYCLLPSMVFNGDSNSVSSTLHKERIKQKKLRENYRHLLKKKEPHYQINRLRDLLLKKLFYRIEKFI
ncbi:glycosyltransferase family 25 protein [Xenorhabdus sp. SGI246]|uniref:glycosyltransferase family 25 protein n=1 Tax=Xenorhabdus sp. SGI246 TaxID=3158263 RepID=UPI00349F7936